MPLRRLLVTRRPRPVLDYPTLRHVWMRRRTLLSAMRCSRPRALGPVTKILYAASRLRSTASPIPGMTFAYALLQGDYHAQ